MTPAVSKYFLYGPKCFFAQFYRLQVALPHTPPSHLLRLTGSSTPA